MEIKALALSYRIYLRRFNHELHFFLKNMDDTNICADVGSMETTTGISQTLYIFFGIYAIVNN